MTCSDLVALSGTGSRSDVDRCKRGRLLGLSRQDQARRAQVGLNGRLGMQRSVPYLFTTSPENDDSPYDLGPIAVTVVLTR
jgi:hypothetical protein